MLMGRNFIRAVYYNEMVMSLGEQQVYIASFMAEIGFAQFHSASDFPSAAEVPDACIAG